MYLEIPVPYKPPTCVTETTQVHKKWLQVLKEAQLLASDDADLQYRYSTGLRLKGRDLPPETIGRFYTRYCCLVNDLYDCYLRNVHLQRAPYVQEILTILLKRLYELRNELVNILLSNYIYIDKALEQEWKTPLDIDIIIPYHIAKKNRTEEMEKLLRKMWYGAIKRKATDKDGKKYGGLFRGSHATADMESRDLDLEHATGEEEVETEVEKEDDDYVPDDPVEEDKTHQHIVLIQKHDRLRVARLAKNKHEFHYRLTFMPDAEARLEVRTAAAVLMKKVYRQYMFLKRDIHRNFKRDLLYNITLDPLKRPLSYTDEANKLYEHNYKVRDKLEAKLLGATEKERARLLLVKRDYVIDDITEHISAWFKEWYYGYGFFPEFPHKFEGGTLLVVRGDFITVEEKIAKDDQEARERKGKTPDQIKQEKKQAAADAAKKAIEDADKAKKEAHDYVKQRGDPRTDPGYLPVPSKITDPLLDALRKYQAEWKTMDLIPEDIENIYGFKRNIITEDIMSQMHVECREIVDELMREDWKLLNKAQQKMFKRVHWPFPKQKARKVKKPKDPPKPIEIDAMLLEDLADLFDVDKAVTKSTTLLKDVYGDLNYTAYDKMIKDPDATFPLPGYGDVKSRLIYSCIFGSGVEAGADRKKAVMLIGPQNSGKTFLVDAVVGELNAVKIDISPELYETTDLGANNICHLALQAARVFQPSVIFFEDIERVYAKKATGLVTRIKGPTYKKPLAKMIKQMIPTERIIFIATCTFPKTANPKLLMALFNETILVPRADYGTVERFLSEKFLKNHSIPYGHPVQAYVNLLKGYPIGTVLRIYNQVMTAERIAKLNIHALSPFEFLEVIMNEKLKPITDAEMLEYETAILKGSPTMYKRRQEFEEINQNRAIAYNNSRNKYKSKQSAVIDGPEETPPSDKE